MVANDLSIYSYIQMFKYLSIYLGCNIGEKIEII